uniref:Leucine rich repeats and calponin homology domain containing 1 n=1 Tax=Malurus cyaneus samueli TaxID=2593467 RepID=A0A8C5TPH5_9PASS
LTSQGGKPSPHALLPAHHPAAHRHPSAPEPCWGPAPLSVVGGGGGSGALCLQAPLNRGLERALEEAAHSGGLNLSGRKLKEFPRSAAGLSHDLSDTVRADLSKNRLTEVPTELCHFVSLETLNLYHNCIKVIPDAIVNLQMLTYLNLSRNQLSSLPACLCGLPLKVLIASNNKLGSLPEEIGQLKQLMELDVSCNEITALPQQIGQLKCLKELNVRRNYLEVLPQELVQLPLVKFDFSCNKVLMIPICFRKMVQLQVLLLENNPLQSPPAQICTKGKVHIFKYLTVQACQIKTADSLYLNAIEPQHLPQPVEESKKDSDSGVGSDNGDKRLSATEPSDEDTLSFNVPMSDIVEEDHIVKDDSGHHANSRKGWNVKNMEVKYREILLLIPCLPTYPEGLGHAYASRAAECDELLKIEEDTQWQADEIINLSEEQTIDIAMIEQLREAVDLLQDSNRSDFSDLLRTRKFSGFAWRKCLRILLDLEINKSNCFVLKLKSLFLKIIVFLRPQRNLESIDPQFTIRRKMEQMREERELVEQLRENIETRLKICLPEDLGSALMDGVVLCHLVNHVRPRSVGSIHVPSPAVPKLSMAKCRRNVENFLDACRKLGIPEADLCSPYDILQSDIRHIRKTVDTLLALGEKPPQSTSTFRSWDLLGFCLVHILFIVLMYITYHWNLLTA